MKIDILSNYPELEKDLNNCVISVLYNIYSQGYTNDTHYSLYLKKYNLQEYVSIYNLLKYNSIKNVIKLIVKRFLFPICPTELYRSHPKDNKV